MMKPWIGIFLLLFIGCSRPTINEKPKEVRVVSSSSPKETLGQGFPKAGHHWLAWVQHPASNPRASITLTAWLHESESGEWRVLHQRGEPTLATDTGLWVILQDCWDPMGNHQDNCRAMQERGEPAHSPQGTFLQNILGQERWAMHVAPREVSVPRHVQGPGKQVKGLKVENLIRPEEPRNFFTIGPYVLWGQSFGPAAIINPEPVLAVQEASTGTWELLLEEGEWARLMKHTPEEIPGKFRTHPALQGNAYQMIEEEGARFEHLSMRFGDDGELGLWANYEVTVCCRRSCSIGPLETFSISLDIELEGMIGKLERWRRAPEPVRGYFIKYGEEARRGWSGLAGEADLERAYTAFLDP